MSWLRRRWQQRAAEAAEELPVPPQPGTWIQLWVGSEPVDACVADIVDDAAFRVDVREVLAQQLRPGAAVVAAWTQSDGLVQLAVEIEPVAESTWWLVRAAGAGEHLQRRRYVRIPAALGVSLRDSAGFAVRTETADLSETGMRCIVRGDVVPRPGAHLDVRLMLDTEPVNLVAEVRRVQNVGTRGHDVALQFVEPYPADVIGRWIMAAQVRLRAEQRH